MSAKFNGFSQEEIERIAGAKFVKPVGPPPAQGTMKQGFKGHIGIRRMPTKTSDGLKKQPTKSAAATKKITSTYGAAQALPNDTLEEVNLDRSLSKSIEEALFYMPTKKPSKPTNDRVKDAGAANRLSPEHNDSSILQLPVNNIATLSSSCTADESSILSELKHPQGGGNSNLNTESPFKGISLKDFETHRKKIEEQNKQKKQLLYEAIEHHSQKTAAETRKIEEIKSELSKLDNDLAIDVAILRKQIDNACLHFANIEKQYMKIEQQFLKAKVDLHNAAEKKELLTEHLCTVIAHNEDRKAQKLSELMHKVGITPTGDYDPLPNRTSDGENIDK